jgi:signal transduction histidine kinase
MGHQKVSWAAIDLNAAIERALLILEGDAKSKRARIEVAKPLPAVWGDRLILDRVLVNLLDNALKFTAPGTPRASSFGRTDARAPFACMCRTTALVCPWSTTSAFLESLNA